MKVTESNLHVEIEANDDPRDVYEAAIKAGSPAAAHLAMRACEAAKEAVTGSAYVDIVRGESVEVYVKNPVPRCNGMKRTLALPASDGDCMALCEEMRQWATARRIEALELEAGTAVPASLRPTAETPAARAARNMGGVR